MWELVDELSQVGVDLIVDSSAEEHEIRLFKVQCEAHIRKCEVLCHHFQICKHLYVLLGQVQNLSIRIVLYLLQFYVSEILQVLVIPLDHEVKRYIEPDAQSVRPELGFVESH